MDVILSRNVVIINILTLNVVLKVLVFTLMGVIVNAGSLLKFVALAVMLVAYSYDCFNNVEKKYLKLNKALFSEVALDFLAYLCLKFLFPTAAHAWTIRPDSTRCNV